MLAQPLHYWTVNASKKLNQDVEQACIPLERGRNTALPGPSKPLVGTRVHCAPGVRCDRRHHSTRRVKGASVLQDNEHETMQVPVFLSASDRRLQTGLGSGRALRLE